MKLRSCVAAVIFSLTLGAVVAADTLVEYQFEGNTNDSSGSGLHGELVGEAVIENGRLFLPGGLDNSMSMPLGDSSPFGGDQDWTVSFEFQTDGGSTGPLFSADGSAQCAEDDDACFDSWPGDQTGSYNVFMVEDGTLVTDFWYIGAIESAFQYNDDEPHKYVATYIAETGEFTQVIDDDDESFEVISVAEEEPYMRDASQDRNFIGDETNSSFGGDFNIDGFNGFFDNVVVEADGDKFVEYLFEGNASDSSGSGIDGELVGDAAVQDGRLFLPGGFDNSMSMPFGDASPFGGDKSWTVSFEFETANGSTGPLFSADGSQECEVDDFDCEDLWPEHEDTGNQSGSLNVFLTEEGAVVTDFWFIDGLESEETYNDGETHTYVGTYDAETGEFIQTVDGVDEVFGEILTEGEGEQVGFSRDPAQDRNLLGDETNGDFGFEFNIDGFAGFFDNVTIETTGTPPGVIGDFNGNGVLDLPDVNLLNQEIAGGMNPEDFDLNGDMLVDGADLNVWVKDLKETWIGDGNLDGEFNTTDLVDVFQAGKYEQDVDAGWEEGDWSGDLRFNTTDLVNAFQDGGFELGPRMGAEVVPEPSSIVLLAWGLLALLGGRRVKGK